MNRTFPLRVVLTVTTGRLLTESKAENDNGIGDMYDLLGHMTNDKPFTHQLGRFAEECKPWLYRWFPELQSVEADVVEFCNKLTDLTNEKRPAAITGFMWGLGERLGKHHFEIGQIPKDDHDVKHPYDELVSELGTDENIIAVEIEP